MTAVSPLAPPQLTFEPVKLRHTVQHQIYAALRQALMSGRFEPGQVLTIDALSRSFGVSHMPVREALRRLAAENALEQTVNGSQRVPTVTRQRLDDLFDARIALETLATRRAAPKMDAAQLNALRAAVTAHATVTAEEGIEALLERNHAVHFIVYRASGSDVLPDLIEALWLRFGPYMRMVSQALAPELSANGAANLSGHHHDLLAALLDGDGAAAAAAVEADITTTCRTIRDLIGPS